MCSPGLEMCLLELWLVRPVLATAVAGLHHQTLMRYNKVGRASACC